MQQAARRLERLEALDKVARPLAGAVGRAVRPRVVRNLLSGTDSGHPLHPVLTDLPIGGGAERLVRYRRAGDRVGLVHAAVNTTALSLYLASLVAGTRGRRRGGQALGLAGLGVLPGGGYLGGHLCFVLGVEVNRTAWEQRPDQ